MNRRYNRLPCKTGLPLNTVLLWHAFIFNVTRDNDGTAVLCNTDAYLPIHTASHPVKSTAMIASRLAIYIQLVRA
jgi:hypothetical protein